MKMRDRRFIAEHRGGPLKKEQHRQLIKWGCQCVEHILTLCSNPDDRIIHAIRVAKAWEEENASVGEARKASVGAHAAAREFQDPASMAVARSAGHAVATAHMADHAPGAADYALKAVMLSGGSVEKERHWQDEQLPVEIRELVLSSRAARSIFSTPRSF
jgi:hypothetical protein